MRRILGRAARHPVAFLGLVNGLCLAIGLAQIGVMAALLPVTAFAVIGVLMAVCGVVANVVDVRLTDLTTRLYFAADARNERARRDILAAAIWLQAGLAGAIGLVVAIGGLLVAPRFLEQPIKTSWVLAVALQAAAQYAIAPVGVHLRLLESFRASGWLRLATTAAGSGLVALLVALAPHLDAYFLAVGLGAAVQLALAAATLHAVTCRLLGGSSLTLPSRAAVDAHMGARSFIASGWLMGTAKAMTRAADVLVVAAFTNDAVTGIYRIARQASDALFALSDAMHQFYTPTIVAAASRHDDRSVRQLRWRVVGLGAATAAAAVIGALAILKPLLAAWLPHLLPVVSPFAALAGLLSITIGIHGWLWPLLVANGRIQAMSLLWLAGAAIQLGALVGLGLAGRLDAVSAALAAWLFYLAVYCPPLAMRALRRLRSRRPS